MPLTYNISLTIKDKNTSDGLYHYYEALNGNYIYIIIKNNYTPE